MNPSRLPNHSCAPLEVVRTSPQPISGASDRVTAAPSARARSWPPRQCPMTGTSFATAERSSSVSGAFHESGSLALIGPPIMAMPENASGSGGTASPASSAITRRGTPCASSHSAKLPGPSVGEKRKMATGRMNGRRRGPRLHLPKEMEELPRDRQPLVPAFEHDELLLRVLAQYAGHRVDVDDCTAMDLPETLRIELGEQFLEGRTDQRLGASEHDPCVFRVGLEVEHVRNRDELHLPANRRLDPLESRAGGTYGVLELCEQPGKICRCAFELALHALHGERQPFGLDWLQ